jgi:hypothetical protein
VDPRETWLALQGCLTNARRAFDAGDRPGALVEIDAALAIDPDFLAAHLLRERILEAPDVTLAIPNLASASANPEPSDIAAAPVSGGGLVTWEQLARRRGWVDRPVDSASVTIENEHLNPGPTAVDEAIELHPQLPAPALTATFETLRRDASRTHLGPRLAAAAVFVAGLLGASLLHDSTSLFSRPMIAAAALVDVPMPQGLIAPENPATISGDSETVAEPAPQRFAAEPPASSAVVTSATAPPPAELPDSIAPVAVPVLPVPSLAGTTQESPVVAPAVAALSAPTPPPAAPAADDNLLVEQALQRYRTAYGGLDAQSAQAVWPAVNQAALARAFDGLQSQSLTFDACDVRVRGESATATCQGSARYVPKIGSREPRVEPRVWNFSLHKAGGDWKIESARADR